ncbi:acetyl-CoA carboxylase biotin carboxyl carrier protein [Alkalihalobacillus hemicellulosilyticus]|uniref:Biotin carboxyl carrier protein of acetyl-CoA carboxylase n=1 Tax=Halalkalibacter hemicellulosilyticusJCM 9152 TaxID=1236971 RepID=W4QIC1_9BACI|nr:acetyl-CoA carboxylase biotin carboxyl carrier protein [Halalkalibacter hemicellulosilyticus]GAE31875.1 biotin carboxyl carrier protein of acetyl-CoA carboxylase [Halalkalibacter hemicellulosilyticusJCM 9152]
MLTVNELKDLIKALDDSNIDELKFEQEGSKLVLKKQRELQVVEQAPVAVQQTQAPVAQSAPTQATSTPQSSQGEEAPAPATNANLHTITSPMVGTFYSAPSPDSDPYVQIGDQVQANSVVCIVEAMKLMNEIEAEVSGKVVEILAENGELVEYGQPLFVVEPA